MARLFRIRSRAGDRRLTRRLLAGDERAFDAFFRDHFPALYRFALVRLDYAEDQAEEIAQTTMCKAISKLSTFRGEATLFTWLCTICRHEISALYRRNRTVARQVDLVEDAPAVRAALESLPTSLADAPDEALGRKEIKRLVQVTLDRLPAKYGNALEWKYLEDLSVREIAGRLNLSPKAAESLLTRARGAFRDGFATLVRGETAS